MRIKDATMRPDSSRNTRSATDLRSAVSCTRRVSHRNSRCAKRGGFAIPLDTIESVVAQLITGGTVVKGYLGITLPGRGGLVGDELEDRNRDLMEAAGYHGRGVYIDGVAADAPAANAGLKMGDIVTRINNRPVAGVAALRQLISINRPGDTVPVSVWRAGESPRVTQ